MAYDEKLADEVRSHLNDNPALIEREMFGGLAFMVHGNMAVGVRNSELMVRVGTDAFEDAVAEQGAHRMDMGSKQMRGWVGVDSASLTTEDALRTWVDRGVAFAESLPPK